MSMVQQLITAVSAAERRIDDQIGQLTAYLHELDNVTRKINSALGGSTQEHEQQMLRQLSDTRTAVSRSIGQLQTAKGMLGRVRMI